MSGTVGGEIGRKHFLWWDNQDDVNLKLELGFTAVIVESTLSHKC